MTGSPSGKKEYLFKVLVVGNSAVGKTSLVRRYVHNMFTQQYQVTIGVDFALKVLHYDEDTLVRIQLWDISGSARYGSMTKVYYRDAVGALVVVDVTQESTIEAVEMWKKDLDTKAELENGSKIPIILLGNKCDATNKDGLKNSQQKLERICAEKGFAAWYHTSAKDNTNIEDAMMFLVEKMLNNYEVRRPFGDDKDIVNLKEAPPPNKKLCCA